MSSKDFIKIEEDLSKFQDRVDEITSATSYDDVKATISKLKSYLNKHKDEVCLCAPQIGINLRMFIIKTAKDDRNPDRYKIFLNPMIVIREGLHLSRESNLSIPGKEYIIPRSNKIHVAYQNYDGRVKTEVFIGAFGEVVQQMVDMLDGINLPDYGLEIDEDFDKAKKSEKEQIIQMYLEYLKSNYSDLKLDIDNNPELKKLNDTIEFNKGLLLGTIKPLDENGNEVDFKEE